MKRTALSAVALLAALWSHADVPQLINYQGRLLNGTNLVNGSVGLSLRLFNVSSGGSPQYEDSNSVIVVDGLYSTFIGDQTNSGNFASALTNAQVWVEVAVNGTALSPRERLAAVAFALNAQRANGVAANAITASMIATGAVQAIHLSSGSVGSAAIADGAIGAAELGNDAVTTAAIANGAVTAAKIKQTAVVSHTLTVTNPAPLDQDHFGYSVTGIGSNMFVVGAYWDDTGATDAGCAYLYDINGAPAVTITNPSPVSGDYFGCAVAAVGSSRIAVGAYRDDTGASDAGCVYLYDTNGILQMTVTNPAPVAWAEFGISVAGVASNLFVVGAHMPDMSGRAYLYNVNGVLQATLTNPAPWFADYFGSSIAGVGVNRIIIGAFSDDSGATDAGCAYLYDTSGVLVTTITNPAPANGDSFGAAVAGIGPDRFLVSAIGKDAGATNSGCVYLYSINGTLMAIIANPAPAGEDMFGTALAGVGTNRFVACRQYSDSGAVDSGDAYLYDISGALLATISNPAPAEYDLFGNSVAAIGPDRFIVGTGYDDAGADDAGSAYVFTAGAKYADGIFSEGTRSGGVSADMLAPAAVTSDKLAGSSVLSGHLTTGSVNSAAIADGAISNADLAAGSVSSSRIADGTIMDGDVNVNAAIAATKIANTALVQTTVFDGSVTGVYNNLVLDRYAVTDHNVAPGAAIAAGKIANTALVQNTSFDGDVNGTFKQLKLLPGSVSNTILQSDAVTSSKIADGTIMDADINVSAAINPAKVANTALVQATVFSGSVTGSFGNLRLTVSAVSNAIIAASAVTGDKIADGTISNADLAANAVTAGKIADGTIMDGDIHVAAAIAAAKIANTALVQTTVFSGSVTGTYDNLTLNAAGLSAMFWMVDGNTGTVAGTHFIGTTDNRPVEIRANNLQALLITPSNGAPNVVIGAEANAISGGTRGASILGGSNNTIAANSSYSTIGGGVSNSIALNSTYSWVSGGLGNHIGTNSDYSFIGGGSANVMDNDNANAVIAGGRENYIGTNADFSAIVSGWYNFIHANAAYSTVAGGNYNQVGENADYGFVGGGANHDIGRDSQYGTVAGGYNNNIGTNASYSTVAGGANNDVGPNAQYAYAAGRRANANHTGSFVWGDASDVDVTSSTSNQVTFRCQGGVRFLNTNGTLSASWVPGAANWTMVSDAALKENVAPVDTKAVLEKVATLPISEWSYAGYPQRHIGPMAQDFHAAFPLNENDRAIDSGDLPGVALAAIKELAKQNAELKAKVDALQARLDAVEKR